MMCSGTASGGGGGGGPSGKVNDPVVFIDKQGGEHRNAVLAVQVPAGATAPAMVLVTDFVSQKVIYDADGVVTETTTRNYVRSAAHSAIAVPGQATWRPVAPAIPKGPDVPGDV